ncbi:MAG: molecular chaperone [Bacteroidota bacterium]
MKFKKQGMNEIGQFKMNNYRFLILNYPLILIVSVLLLAPSIRSTAQGDLLVFPKRIVFDETKKSQSINISNTGRDTSRYIISFVQIRMKEDGNFENITQPDPNQYFADPYLRIFPRQVVLGPNESQVVKIQLQKTDQIVPGEYRSHLYFRAMPDVKPLGEKEIQKDTASISVKLIPVFGITIPIIIRKGETTAKVSLSNISFQKVNDSIPVLKLDFNRNGNISVYGDITVNLILPNGKTTKVGEIDGFAVYTPGMLRKCKIELKKGIDYNKGKLLITYSASAEDKGSKLAEAELELH